MTGHPFSHLNTKTRCMSTRQAGKCQHAGTALRPIMRIRHEFWVQPFMGKSTVTPDLAICQLGI